MIAVLQWVAFGLSVACAVWRLPSAIRGRNASLFWAFLLLSIAVGLSLPAIYLPVDGLLGGRNFANLILRFTLYAIFFILAAKIAAAYRSPRAQRLIRGPIGVAALLLICVATVVPFLLSDLPVSSTGLAGYHQFPIGIYVLAGRLYPAYAAACLLRPSAQAARSGLHRMDRIAAGIVCASFGMVVLLTVLEIMFFQRPDVPPAIPSAISLLSYGAIICLAVGLALVWISIRIQRRKAANPPLARTTPPL